jgi:hypothetical protein
MHVTFCSLMRFAVVVCMLASAGGQTERKQPASEAELAAITARGRALAEYDTAVWHASEAFMAVTQGRGHEKVSLYVARKDGDAWEVVYGKLNSSGDKLLIACVVRQTGAPHNLRVKQYDPVKEESGYYFFAAKALVQAWKDFNGESKDFKRENRPYRKAVLPADEGKFYVYVYPGMTDEKVWVLGSDIRYLVSANGATILDRHRMHNSILEFRASDEIKTTGLVHSAILDEVPEDTDVFLAMTFQPAVNHTVITKHFLYGIFPDGKAVFLMTMEAYKKISPAKGPN